ncbi:MAG: hypothetical protein ABSG75_18125 [Syntrophales bacterium]
MTKLEKLDSEHKSRLKDVFRSRKSQLTDIFLNDSISKSIPKTKVIIPSYNYKRILCAYPFSREIYVLICPQCDCVKNRKDIVPLIQHQAIIPILTNPYAKYPEDFIDTILPFSHISSHEFYYYHQMALLQDHDILCSHCAKERKNKLDAIIRSKNLGPVITKISHSFFANLYPFIKPDFELYDCYTKAIEKEDKQLILQLTSLSFQLRNARLMQTYNGRPSISREALPRLILETKKIPDINVEKEATVLSNVLSKELHLSIPEDIPTDKYLEILDPYRNELSDLMESLLTESTRDGQVSLTNLYAKVAELNNQLLSLPKKKRFLFYRASTAFLKSNNTLLASGLLAGIMGLTGSTVACGLGILSGFGLEIAKRKGKLKVPKEVKRFGEELGHTIRPQVHKLLAKCLNLDIKAVQIWDIRERLEHKKNGTA